MLGCVQALRADDDEGWQAGHGGGVFLSLQRGPRQAAGSYWLWDRGDEEVEEVECLQAGTGGLAHLPHFTDPPVCG